MHWLVLLIAFAARCLVEAQQGGPQFHPADENYVVRQWQTADGLPQNTVSAIAQTPDHYLWLGTFNGLVRFDGTSFKTYSVRNVPALRSDYVTALLVTADGKLWISTDGGGITVLEHGKFRNLPDQADVDILELVEGRNGEVWFSSMRSIFCYRDGKIERMADSFPDLYPFRGMAIDPKGVLWTTSKQGLHKVESGKLTRATEPRETLRLLTERDGTLWYAENGRGLFRKIGAHSQLVFPAEVPPETIKMAPDWKIWVSGAGHKLSYFDSGQLHEFRSIPALVDHDITCIYPDSEGNIWIGLDGAGLLRLREKTVRSLHAGPDGTRLDNAVTMSQDQSGRMWIGRLGSRAGINWIKPGTLELMEGAPVFNRVWPSSILTAKSGRVWIGTFGFGLFWWENNKLHEQVYGQMPFTGTTGNVIRVLFEDSKSRLWIGTDSKGVERHDGQEKKTFTTAQRLGSNKITAIAETPDGSIWLGTGGGLHRIDAADRIHRYGTEQGLAVNAIHALHVDRRGNLWIGTAGGGISWFHKDRVVTITTEQGLINDVVGQILEDNAGDLWIGTNFGIAKLTKRELDAYAEGKVRFIHPVAYTAAEGLPSDECGGGFQPACMKDSGGKLWFSTIGGVVSLEPQTTSSLSKPPVVHLQEMVVDGKEVQVSTNAVGTTITVPAGSMTLEIGFTGIDYAAPERVSYSYKLEGYDPGWVNSNKRRRAFYTKIPPGEYRFKARAGNNQGLGSETAPLIVVVNPLWYQTTAFALMAIVGLTAGLGGISHYRHVKQAKEKQRHEEFARKLIESQERERQRVSRELHDSLGQSLLVIKNRAFVAMQDSALLPSLKSQLEEICAASGEAVQEVRQISQALRPPQLERLGLTRTIEGLIKQVGEVGDYAIEVAIRDIDNCFAIGDQIHFLRIVQECLNNILKHSKASSIKITLKREGRTLEFFIADDGCGFDLAERMKRGDGLGMTVIAERVNILRGQLEVESAIADGTRIRVKLPVKELDK